MGKFITSGEPMAKPEFASFPNRSQSGPETKTARTVRFAPLEQWKIIFAP
jgi:hypothetical protein